ncbi:MAG TPA: ABC transporter permease [Bryobacteraceae bacterium]|nr:ABC transporter permease [Bryobacteraceae bacterium]
MSSLLADLAQDVRYSLRGLRQRPAFAAIALATLALGIGATTVIFTLFDGVLLKPLPYAHPERLVRLQEQTDWSTAFGNLWGFTYPNFLDCARQSHTVSMAAIRFGGGTVSKPGEAENVEGRQISAGLFSLLGVPLFRGREFRADEDQPGAPPVAIISYGMWQHRFGGRRDVIGSSLVLEGAPYTVVGIAPAAFRLFGVAFDVFTPIGQNTAPYMKNRNAHGNAVVASLANGVTLRQAQAELALIGRRLQTQYPESNKGRIFIADPLRPDVGNARSTLWLLLGAVTLVLLIACVNVASLLLARAVSRERELAMRVALGAGRSRLVRQCLTEGAVLSLSGGALGAMLAALALRPFVTFWPGTLPRADEVHLDWPILLLALAVSLASGLLFGLAPALRVPVRALEQALRAGARTVAGSSRHLHGAFVVSEIALAMVLLVAAGMLGRTLLRLSALDAGINIHNVFTARVGLGPGTLASTDRTRAAWDDILDRARRVPGVRAAAIVDTVPMREGNNPIGYRTSPAPVPPAQQPLTMSTCVTPDYTQVTGVSLRAGRFFTSLDRLGSQGVVVIDDVMAQQAFPGQDAVGKHLWIDFGSDPVTVVGVVGHVRYWGLAADDQSKIRAQLYYPLAQVPDRFMRRWSELLSIAVRTDVAPLSITEPLKHQIRGAAGDQVIYEIRTLEQLAAASLARQRFLLLLFGIFGALALLLASIGLYGVIAYLTGRRVPEIGVRMALGATARDVVRLVMRQSLAMVTAGVALGLAAALAVQRLFMGWVEGMQPAEPATLGLMILLLAAAGLLAGFVPARRASRIDPMRALRQD